MARNFSQAIEGTAKVLEVRGVSTELQRDSCDFDLRVHLLFDVEFQEGGEVDDGREGSEGASE